MMLDPSRIRSPGLLAFAGAALASTLTTFPAQGAPISGQCSTPKAAYSTSIASKITAGPTYVDITEASVKFTQGGDAPSCAVVLFSAEALAPNAYIALRAILDNSAGGAPGTIIFQDGDSTSTASRDFTFVFANVSPGPHTVKMQMRSSNSKSVAVYFHTTLVLHP